MPDWTCPTCEKGVLKLEEQSFLKAEEAKSRDHSHEAWEPEWISYIYTCLLCCSNSDCKELVSSSGTGSVDWEPSEDGQEQVWFDYFTPLYFYPHLKIIAIPKKCPGNVSEPIIESFGLFFLSPSSAANSIRIAIEELLTELKIKKYSINNGKRKHLPLHQRILLIPDKYSELKDIVLAIKWIGNAGSHGSTEVNAGDVLDAYEFLEHVLQEIYKPSKELVIKAKKVNKQKGPVRKK
jgi:hypothetical protein